MSDINQFIANKDLLQDKVIFITGAGDGIGHTLAITCAEYGAKLVLLGRTAEKLTRLEAKIQQQFETEILLLPVDLKGATPNDYDQIADKIRERFGKLDALIHNAGILGGMYSVEHCPPLIWLEVMHINVSAAFLLTQPLLPLLSQSEDARIIFTSSGVGRVGKANWGAYAVSKFAVEGFNQVLASEMDNTKIRVIAINPGACQTHMRQRAYPAEDPRKLPHPRDLMPSYLYLLSAHGAKLHGQSVDAQ